MNEISHYTWQPEGGNRSIRLSFEALDGILQDVLRGFSAIPKRGAEVGGILLGKVEGSVITIDAFEPVPCEYKLGPSYHLTAADQERFDGAITQLANSDELVPVGFYRSDTREGLTLDEEDRKLLDRWFPHESAIALLIRPFATKVSRAGFFYRIDGSFCAQTPLEFPFSRKLLGGGSPRRPEQPVAPEPPPVPVSVSPAPAPFEEAAAFVRTAEPVVERVRSNKSLWAAGLALAIVLGWSGGYFTARSLPPPPNPDDYRLALTIVPRTTDLSIVWDGKSPALQTAVRGQLHIREGGAEKTVPLDLEQLRLGAVVYRHVGGAVRFELEVQQIAGSVVREVREFTLPPGSPAP